MTNWLKKQISLGNIVEILLLIIALIWLIAFIRADIDRNERWNVRQDQQHGQFMRQDVGAAQFDAIRKQLDRIEKKIED